MLDLLNPAQKQAALTTEGPLLVLAGAGSGKTKMLTSRIAHLMESGLAKPHEILAVTFTNKAAGEMRERVERSMEKSQTPVYGIPEIGTFHAVCGRILRREAGLLPFTKPYVIYDDSDQLSVIKSVLKKLNIDDKVMSAKSFQYAIDRAKCDAVEPEDMQAPGFSPFERVLKDVYRQYKEDMIGNNAMDFGEILCATYRILRDHPEVRARYQKRFKYIHVDEYQDTNRVQYLILNLLAHPSQGGHGNICVVGDEDQSIYKWRGADIKNILDFEKDYFNAQVVKLEQNYRSTKTIISAASDLIGHNTQRKNKKLWTDNEDGSPIVQLQVADEREEADVVVKELARLARDENRSMDEFAIFYRTHAQSRQFEDFLRRDKIPYQVLGGLRFYDRKEIKDILCYLRLIINPLDSVSVKRVINTPARGIGKTTVDKLEALGNGNLWLGLEAVMGDPSHFPAKTSKKLTDFAQMILGWIHVSASIKVSEMYHRVLDDIQYVKALKDEGTEEADARIDNLEEFDTLVAEFEEEVFSEEEKLEAGQALVQFLERTTLASVTDDEGKMVSTVKLMSLHSSKGLEYPVVFLVGMEEGLFPSIREGQEKDPEELEEERRLCYVGMTRARERLYLSHANIRRQWGQFSYQYPSRFLEEIPQSFRIMRDFAGSRKTESSSYTSSYSSQGYQAPKLSVVPTYESSDSKFIGKRFDHPDYGYGKIVSSEGSGDTQKVMVEFKDQSKRKFLFRYVKSFLED
ncbi:MAG: UvrD-helicase domain-containing protein [Xanthomonadaceae bacterium]|nr:UvrD-helicase domain-containing protein [Xanthomonadaceae bacterium]